MYTSCLLLEKLEEEEENESHRFPQLEEKHLSVMERYGGG